MAKQLIFGSVPHGLQPGRSGYCLVAGHTDLPQSLIRQLEQETSVFPERGEPGGYPAHQIRKTGDTAWHLFTRQTLHIQDYSGRLSGITHVIAERVDQFPSHLNPETLLLTFQDWVTSLPAMPRTFGAAEEIDLGKSQSSGQPDPAVQPEGLPGASLGGPGDEFRLNPGSSRSRPSPRPRSGFYYRRRRSRGPLGWLKRHRSAAWIGLALVLAIVAALLVL